MLPLLPPSHAIGLMATLKHRIQQLFLILKLTGLTSVKIASNIFARRLGVQSPRVLPHLWPDALPNAHVE